ncbi:hypothetical protein BB560_001870 [Smittium megazygosporum]|uniref:Uncharacterized protein n=1 Tax=Smittium megazygosporum TaxID=133381 RepID=A0A2T9ZGC7_9FUNG|nr:hypothetical protein BB560_001870 [Smittium megazygosporum]
MILEKFANFLISSQIKAVEKLNFGRSFISISSILIGLSYSFYSKYNFINPPNTRFNHYIDEYVKENPVEQQSEQPIAIVTGANSGIGYTTSKALMLAGFHVIFACRNKDLATEAMDKIKKETNLETCEYMHLDLSSFESIHQFTTEFKSKYASLKLLVNNAGVMMCPYLKTKDGIEMQFGTNHVGHFILTNNLLDVLKRSSPARIVNVSSLGHLFADTSVEEIKQRTIDSSKYHEGKNYGNSKIANIMFSTLLAKKLSGTGVVVNSLHPGAVNTELHRYAKFDKNFIMNFFRKLVLLTPTAGSLSSIKLAISPELEDVSGKYFAWENEAYPRPLSQDIAACQELWDFTESLIQKHSK